MIDMESKIAVNAEIVSKEYSIGTLVIGKDGVLELISDKESFCLEDYEVLVKSIKDISGGRLLPYLTDERGKQRYMDKESKKFLNDNLHKYVAACAVVEDSPVLRFLVYVFTSIYKSQAPIRMYKTKEDARAWLVEFL